MISIVVLICNIGIAPELRYRYICINVRRTSDLLVRNHKSWTIQNFYPTSSKFVFGVAYESHYTFTIVITLYHSPHS
jgi:hypothetical protein